MGHVPPWENHLYIKFYTINTVLYSQLKDAGIIRLPALSCARLNDNCELQLQETLLSPYGSIMDECTLTTTRLPQGFPAEDTNVFPTDGKSAQQYLSNNIMLASRFHSTSQTTCCG